MTMTSAVRPPLAVVAAEMPERPWDELRCPPQRRPPPAAVPADFAAAMRRVEREVYDA